MLSDGNSNQFPLQSHRFFSTIIIISIIINISRSVSGARVFRISLFFGVLGVLGKLSVFRDFSGVRFRVIPKRSKRNWFLGGWLLHKLTSILGAEITSYLLVLACIVWILHGNCMNDADYKSLDFYCTSHPICMLQPSTKIWIKYFVHQKALWLREMGKRWFCSNLNSLHHIKNWILLHKFSFIYSLWIFSGNIGCSTPRCRVRLTLLQKSSSSNIQFVTVWTCSFLSFFLYSLSMNVSIRSVYHFEYIFTLSITWSMWILFPLILQFWLDMKRKWLGSDSVIHSFFPNDTINFIVLHSTIEGAKLTAEDPTPMKSDVHCWRNY